MSYTHDRDKMPSIHPQLGKFDFIKAKDMRLQALSKGIGSKEWIEFATMMFEQFPFIYNTCLLMNDESRLLRTLTDWRSIQSAPKDGTKVLVLFRHINYEYADDDEKHQWQEECEAEWTEFNGCGWVWNGIAGTAVAWKPLSPDRAMKG